MDEGNMLPRNSLEKYVDEMKVYKQSKQEIDSSGVCLPPLQRFYSGYVMQFKL